MKERSMKTVPKDGTHILLKIEGKWIEGYYDSSRIEWDTTCWDVVNLSSHGCGCCSTSNADPTAWCPLPKEGDQK